MSAIILRPPYIKGKGYVVNPIVKYGIPKEADSRNYPNVIGTVAWEQFWSEELYRIFNGYQTGGLWVPGRYYYYMNYTVMSTITGTINPDATDLHLELAYLIDYCKKNGKNIMIPKGRRRGISEATHPMVIDYGYRFSIDKYQAGVAAGHSKPIDDFITKWKFADTKLPPEFFTGRLTKNDDEIIAGYAQKNDLNAWEDKGTFNTIYTRTMHSNVNGFKGLFLNDVVVEEVGEFENFLAFFAATKDCLMSNQKQIGSMFVYGTGGSVNKGSRDFKKAWSREETNNFIETNNFVRFVADARRFYYYGSATLEHQRLPSESELYKKYKEWQLIGVEDLTLAEKDILKKRETFLKSGNLKDYNEFLQNNPITEAEIFRKTVINNFDVNKLNTQVSIIDALSHPKWTKYKLEWVKDDKGMIKVPLAVKRLALKPHEDQDVCIWMLDGGEPQLNFTNRYCAGIDSYNVDQSKSSKSLGAMLVLDRQTKIPVACISCRPKRKETFFEMCIMLSVHYKMYNNVLGDIGSDTIIKHFEQHGCYSYLADRPKKFESEHSEQSHEKWVRLTDYSRPRMVGIMQSHVTDFCQEIWFPELLNQLGNYDEVEKGSDNDLADAYGIALMQDLSYDIAPRNEDETKMDDRYKMTRFVDDGKGGLKMQTEEYTGGIVSPEADSELMRQMFG